MKKKTNNTKWYLRSHDSACSYNVSTFNKISYRNPEQAFQKGVFDFTGCILLPGYGT